MAKNETQPRDFGFGESEEMLQDAMRRLIADKSPLSHLRGTLEGTEDPYHGSERAGSYHPEIWEEMVSLGWPGLAVPEEDGGAGMGLVTAAAVAEEIGRAAMPSPLTSTLQTCFVLREANVAACRPWLAKIAEGASATLALTGADGSLEPDSTQVQATSSENGALLNGTSYFVQDAQKADFAVVAARNERGIGLYAVALDAPGMTLLPDRIVDLTRDQGRLRFDNTEAEPLVQGNDGVAVLTRALPALLTLVAADIVGAAEWQLQETAEYAKTRTQFDRPIGFFQAVKHPIVNMMISVDESRSLVYNAACAYDFDPDDATRCAHLAKSSASDTASFCSNRATQLHGGIAFTWESDAQLYFKRQKHSQFLYGDGPWQREKLADLIA